MMMNLWKILGLWKSRRGTGIDITKKEQWAYKEKQLAQERA